MDQATEAVYDGSHQAQDSITADDVMSIRGIVASPAGVNSRVSAVEDTMKSELRRLENKIDAHQNWARPILTGIAVGLAFYLLNVFAKPLFESIGRGSTDSQSRATPATTSAPAAPAQPTQPARQ